MWSLGSRQSDINWGDEMREPVACSTVTVTKCQAALRTLQAFPFFRPTCLCKEPGIDPDCNYFRDFLFDHPCGFVSKKELLHKNDVITMRLDEQEQDMVQDGANEL
uniref:GDNF/GAS1 domain-containing protein n=1 Tax=Anopheles merus TaxID=30066 RepID=A0A182UMJ1_ANOME